MNWSRTNNIWMPAYHLMGLLWPLLPAGRYDTVPGVGSDNMIAQKQRVTAHDEARDHHRWHFTRGQSEGEGTREPLDECKSRSGTRLGGDDQPTSFRDIHSGRGRSTLDSINQSTSQSVSQSCAAALRLKWDESKGKQRKFIAGKSWLCSLYRTLYHMSSVCILHNA